MVIKAALVGLLLLACANARPRTTYTPEALDSLKTGKPLPVAQATTHTQQESHSSTAVSSSSSGAATGSASSVSSSSSGAATSSTSSVSSISSGAATGSASSVSSSSSGAATSSVSSDSSSTSGAATSSASSVSNEDASHHKVVQHHHAEQKKEESHHVEHKKEKHHYEEHYHQTPHHEAHYHFKYSVKDDHKSHEESRKGYIVDGKYTVESTDGHKRSARYASDKHPGLDVKVIGEPIHKHEHEQEHYENFHDLESKLSPEDYAVFLANWKAADEAKPQHEHHEVENQKHEEENLQLEVQHKHYEGEHKHFEGAHEHHHESQLGRPEITHEEYKVLVSKSGHKEPVIEVDIEDFDSLEALDAYVKTHYSFIFGEPKELVSHKEELGPVEVSHAHETSISAPEHPESHHHEEPAHSPEIEHEHKHIEVEHKHAEVEHKHEEVEHKHAEEKKSGGADDDSHHGSYAYISYSSPKTKYWTNL